MEVIKFECKHWVGAFIDLKVAKGWEKHIFLRTEDC